MAQAVRRNIMQQLADGVFHSGEGLGQSLGLSRAAVWKHIQALQEDGLPIESVHGKGYRLSIRMELLQADTISSHLPATLRDGLCLELFDELESTNEYLLRQLSLKDDRPRVCLAERQTAGRGRRGRSWYSPYGTSLAFSLLWRFDFDASRLAGLSLAVGVCIADALQFLDIEGVQLKWPNDLLWQGRKLGGILIEVRGDTSGPCYTVIGIGLNINNRLLAEQGHADAQLIDQPWTDLASILQTQEPISRNRLAAAMIDALYNRLPEFESRGFSAFADRYRTYDALQGAEVIVYRGHDQIRGQAAGVDGYGCLNVRAGNEMLAIHSGEVSLRMERAEQ